MTTAYVTNQVESRRPWLNQANQLCFEARRRVTVRRQLRKAGHLDAARLPTLRELRSARRTLL